MLKKALPYISLLCIFGLIIVNSPLFKINLVNWLDIILYCLAIISTGLTLIINQPMPLKATGKRQKIIGLISFVLIISFFVGFKGLDILSQPIADMKEVAFVGPAIEMADHHNPFLIIKQYRAQFFQDQVGQINTFGSVPVLTWPLALIFGLFKIVSFELVARSMMVFWGVALLSAIFLLVRRVSNSLAGLITVLFLATDYLFNLISFKTVLDTVMLFFVFLSLYYLVGFLKKESTRSLFWSGVLAGLAVWAKVDAFLIIFPISCFLIIYYQRQIKNWLPLVKIYGFLSLLPWLLFRLFVNKLPSANLLPAYLILIGSIVAFIALLYLLNKYFSEIRTWLEKIIIWLTRHWLILVGYFVLLLALIILAWQYLDLNRLAEDFLTDSRLLSNSDVYLKILKADLKKFIRPSYFYLFYLAFISLLFGLKNNRFVKVFLWGLVIGGTTFLVLASKPIFIHNYYQAYFVILAYIFIGILFSLLISYFSRSWIKGIALILLLGILILGFGKQHYRVNGLLRLKQQKAVGIKKASHYLKKNTTLEQGFWEGQQTFPLAMYANRAGYQPNVISRGWGGDRLKKEVNKKGLFQALKDNGVRYYITDQDYDIRKSWLNIANWLEGKVDGSDVLDRGEKVLEVIAKKKNPGSAKRELSKSDLALLEEYQFEKHLIFEKKIRNFHFYRIKP